MTIEALLVGKLHARAEQRTSKAGKPFVTTKARVNAGDGDCVFVSVIAFNETACAALLALEAGDALALAGTVKPGAWVDREGNPKPSLDMVAAQVLTVYGLKKKRETIGQAGERPPRQQPPGENFGHDDEWLTGGAHVG